MAARIVRADHPRIRGEHLPAWFVEQAKAGSSPHTRGALPYLQDGFGQIRIIPAYAGSTSSRRRC